MDIIQDKIKRLPNDPGVYIMKDKDENIIYVGKAKNLKKRVGQYFKTWKILFHVHFNVSIRFAVFKQNVIVWFMFFDKVIFKCKCFNFAVYNEKIKVNNIFNHILNFNMILLTQKILKQLHFHLL